MVGFSDQVTCDLTHGIEISVCTYVNQTVVGVVDTRSYRNQAEKRITND